MITPDDIDQLEEIQRSIIAMEANNENRHALDAAFAAITTAISQLSKLVEFEYD